MNPSHQRHMLRIFLVENHADTLESLKLYLEDNGHTVLTARTLTEARKTFPKANCQVLICDIGLPDGTGWDLLESARSSSPVYAIAMSGFGMNADSQRSRQAGFRHHLLKPFRTEELDKVLSEAMTGNLDENRERN